MTAAIIDLSLIRARRATGQPLVDKPVRTFRSGGDVFVPGDYVRSPDNLEGVIAEFRILCGVEYAFIIGPGWARRSVPTRDLVKVQCPWGAA